MINHVYAADNSSLNYTNDSKGIYPTASWQPTGQTTVSNPKVALVHKLMVISRGVVIRQIPKILI
ncbi:hypothetical protein [Weissella cibaria]|uniref:hypothetical protein n=1 Tax=Weissella cibaria TaxID=137591 RepID=UPI0016479198|nr:hypothetical protein [Weissella cibaria]